MLLPVICLTLFVLTKQRKPEPQKAPTPVVLIPGIFGNQVDGWYKKKTAPHYYCSKDSGGWTRLWLCLECMIPTVLGCWTDNFSLNISDVSNIKNRDGMQTKVNDFGYTDGLSYLDSHGYVIYYEDVIKGIADLPGYFRGQNIRGAPYDFRFAPNSRNGWMYNVELQKLIEETYLINYNTRVMVIAHSMGNPVMVNFFKFVSQEWKDQYIDSFVAINGVFGGSAKAIRALASGETEGAPGIILDYLTMRSFEQTIPTVYWLLPMRSLFKDDVLVITDKRNYTAQDYPQLLKDIGAKSGPEIYQTVEDLPTFEEDLGVDVYCIHGINNTTPFQFQYSSGGFPDTFPTTIMGNGDGTVNLKSLELCKKFKRLKSYKTISGALSQHLEILQNVEVIQTITDLLLSKQHFRQTQQSMTFKQRKGLNETIPNETEHETTIHF